jgi:CHAT domain-containing protein/tetratricopeptide (TPR) repeat protein
MVAQYPSNDDRTHLSAEVRELLSQLEGLSRPEDVLTRIRLLEYILTLLTPTDFPGLWAELHIELGNALRQNPTDKSVNLMQSITCYDTAAAIYTREGMPTDWTQIQYYKGTALHELAGMLSGSGREKMLRGAIACFEEILAIGDHQLTLPIRVDRGAFLQELARLISGSEQEKLLQDALASFDEILQGEYREKDPPIWAAAQSNKCSVLRTQAALLTDPEQRIVLLKTAIDSYDAALSVYADEKALINWAATQNNKGETLSYLADQMTGEKCQQMLREAIACYDAALTGYTREKMRSNWVIAHNNKGIVLYNLSRLLIGAERVENLQAALACFNIVLLEQRREGIPLLDWAQVQHNKGRVLCDLATQFVDTERVKALQEAITCFDEALLGWGDKVALGNWVRTQNNKGDALRDLAGLLRGAGRAGALNAAITCFETVLQKISREDLPTDWAMTQNNKSMALRDLAAILGLVGTERARTLRVKMLRAAIVCCDEALKVYTHEREPAHWSRIYNNKGNALLGLASELTDVEQNIVLQAAVACYNVALLEQSRETSPIGWAMIQNNKGMALRNLVKRLEGDDRAEMLREIVVCYDAVISVYTREVLPADHYRIAQSIGMLLFKEGDWKNAARYLATALDALDDLFILEITTYGRSATLKAGNDLTAHLAYALVRTGTVDAAKLAAEALERGRARVTGEVITRQEAQLTAARRLIPEHLLEQFRDISGRLVKISLVDGISDTSQTALSPDRKEVVGDVAERTALAAVITQLSGYQEAWEARQNYNAIVERIREMLPDFLLQEKKLDADVLALAPDERLVYIASTPLGAVALLIGSAFSKDGTPIVECWSDEWLTSKKIATLLVGPATEGDKLVGESPGLLMSQSTVGTLRRALLTVMKTLGGSDGVLAHLALYCRTAKIRRLILVPCGLLGLLPLHATLVPTISGGTEAEPLLDVAQVSYAPSVRIWAVCKRRAEKHVAEKANALLVSDPQPRNANMSPLPGAEDEVQIISEIITHKVSGQVFSYNGIAATLPAILDGLKTHGAALTHVHFACHGLADLDNPYTSGFLLAHGDRLMARDLLNATVVRLERLRVAVLSACQTALTGTELPDEVIGLPAGWLQAGAMAVLASLWPVSDSKTVALMMKFYELHLLDGCDPIEALWLAQRWFRQLPTWRDDCRAAGASWAARGLQVSEVMRDLELVKSHRGKKLLDDPASLITAGMNDEDAPRNLVGYSHAAWERATTGQSEHWEDAQHWAAFALYGV